MHSAPACAHTRIAVPLLTAYLIEDSAVIRKDLTAALEELAPVVMVGWADNEATALQWLSHAKPAVDLVIVDLFLRAGSGMGVLRALAAMPGKTHFVVLTNFASADIRRKCLALGAERVFDKSNDIEALIAHCAALSACPRAPGHEAVPL